MSDMFDDAGDWGGHACRGEGAELEAPKLPHAPVDWGTLPSRLVSDVVLHRGLILISRKDDNFFKIIINLKLNRLFTKSVELFSWPLLFLWCFI